MHGFVLSDPFLFFYFDVCFWITVLLEDPTTAHCKISSRGCQVLIFFYLLVFERIHDAMSLNKMSRTSSRKLDQQY